ncbi:MAG: hypothetical protein ACLRS2_08540 [[Clostridium] innocuum]
MIYEGIILQRNHDLAEVCLLQRRKNRYVFLPERVMELIRPGMRILFMGQEWIQSPQSYTSRQEDIHDPARDDR